jgi:hypothetical protein
MLTSISLLAIGLLAIIVATNMLVFSISYGRKVYRTGPLVSLKASASESEHLNQQGKRPLKIQTWTNLIKLFQL